MEIYYLVVFKLSVVLGIFYVYMWNKRFNIYFSLLFLIIPIANYGYLQQIWAENVDQMLMGNKISYLGGCFGTMSLALCICELCKVHLKKYIKGIMFILSSIMFNSALSIGYVDNFYKSVEFKMINGVPYLVKEYGIVHTLFYVMLVFYYILAFYAIIKGLYDRKNVSIKIASLLFWVMSINVISYFIGRQVLNGIELMPAGYLFGQIVFLIIAGKLVLYDVDETVVDVAINKGDLGVISFDKNFKFLGTNDVARKFLPVIETLIIDEDIPENDEYLFEKLKSEVHDFEKDGKLAPFQYRENGKIYKFEIGRIGSEKRTRGYQFMISDVTDEQKYIEILHDYNDQLSEEVKEKDTKLIEKNTKLKETHERLVFGMAEMVENRDESTGGHIKRTSHIVEILVNEIKKDNAFNLSPEFCEAVIKAAPMHDLGKIAVDDGVLRKPGKFTKDEFEIMKTHAEKGSVIVKNLLGGLEDEYFANIAENVAHYHHERVDGSGYPNRLSGDEIPIEARIMAIADVYDALVSKRCYKDSMSFEEAYNIIIEGMGTQFDSRLQPYFDKSRPVLEDYYKNEFGL